jgi:hypothetical protein
MKKFVRGAVAGAAGTTALNAVGYADMPPRGRSASSVPARVAEQLARRVGGTIPAAMRHARTGWKAWARWQASRAAPESALSRASCRVPCAVSVRWSTPPSSGARRWW